MNNLKEQITEYAKKDLRIDTIGYCSAEIPQDDLLNYYQYLKEKKFGDMTWMQSRKNIRENPNLLLDNLNTIIVIGCNYYDVKSEKDYKMSIYANQQQDYHKWVYKKCKKLVQFLEKNFQAKSRCFVDSAPILEKVFAKKTQIGWQGKHTCIVSREFGNWLFLGVILTDLKIEFDEPSLNFCGSCTKCIDACPVQAITPYKLDTLKCISYLTIESKQNLNNNQNLEGYVFGCDECLKACHFNKWQKQSQHQEVKENLKFPSNKKDFLSLKEDDFNLIFQGTPVKRTGFNKIMNNIKTAFQK